MNISNFSLTKQGKKKLAKYVGGYSNLDILSNRDFIEKAITGLSDKIITENTIASVGSFIIENDIEDICIILRNSRLNMLAILSDKFFLVIKNKLYSNLEEADGAESEAVDCVLNNCCNNIESKRLLRGVLDGWYLVNKHLDLYDLLIMKIEKEFSSSDIFVVRNE